MGVSSGALSNQFLVARHIFTNISIMGTSAKTPTTVARDEPEARPKSMVEVARDLAYTAGDLPAPC